MRILVTGATGYLGSASVRYLRRQGYEVVAASRTAAGNLYGYGELSASTDWGDLLNGIDVVVHTAAIVHNPSSSEQAYQRVNIDAVSGLATQAARSGVQLFIHLSSAAVYGEYLGRAFTEDDTPTPTTAYGRSKLESERYLADMQTLMQRVILRCPMIYGQGAPGNYRQLEKLIDRGIPLPIKGVKNRRSFLSTYSFVSTLEKLIELQAIPDGATVLNLAEEPASTLYLARAIAKLRQKPCRAFYLPELLGSLLKLNPRTAALLDKVRGDYLLSGERTNELLSWRPNSSLLDNLTNTP